VAAARHPARRDGVIAAVLLLLPWALWTLVPRHRFDAASVALLVTVSVLLAGSWLTWAGFRRASRPAPAGSGTRPGIVTAGPGSVVAGGGGSAVGPAVYQQRREVTGKPVRLADPPPLLAGREDLLAELDIWLTGGGDSSPRSVALCGLAGAGKTSLALAYAHRHLAEVGVAWQFPAGDATVLAAGFAELAARLGARDLAGIQDPVTSVHAVLARSAAPWLLIFDNAAETASVAAFVPPAGPGRVLVTSQNPAWLGRPLDVPMLDRDAAAAFLVNRTGGRDRQAARDLADELGGLPLALEQAAAYIDATGGTLARYLALFRQRRAEVLVQGEPTGSASTVASTWALAFDRLQQDAPGAGGLLRLLAFYQPEAIPLPLLLQPRPGLAGRLGEEVAPVLVPLLEDQLAAGDAIAALRGYSLVTPAAGRSVSVHRLVQAVTEDQMPAELAAQWRQAAAALIVAALPDDATSPGSWREFAALLPHAYAAVADDSAGMAQIASYLAFSGSYAAARDLQRRVLGAREQLLGPEHPDTLTTRHNLARWTGQAGDPAAARDLYAELLPVRERVLGPEQPDTLTTRYNLARWTGQAGDPAAARDLHAELLPVVEWILGPEHRHTLANRHSLASSTGEAGDPAAARDLYAELLPVVERVLGPEHRNTLTTRGNLARWTGQAGDPAAARDLYADLLPAIERVSGPEHPDTLTTRGNLAGWTGEAGDPAAARDLYADLLPAIERVLSPEHPDTLTVRVNLASWTGEAGNPAAARDLYADLLPAIEQVSGPEHPDTLTTRGSLARWTGQAGDPAAALDLFAELLPVREWVSGPEHPDTLTVHVSLADWTGQAGNPAAARDRLTELLPVVERVSGPEHPDTLTTRGNLAGWTGEAGDPAAARDLYAELLPVRERILGPEHPDTLTTRGNLASWTGEAGDPAAARDVYAELLPVVEQVLGQEHPHTSTTRRNLAYWTRKAKRVRSKG
jgi:Tetratricopeptide repeat